jgi:hypothetical protein
MNIMDKWFYVYVGQLSPIIYPCWFIIGSQESIVIVLPNTNITMICDYLEKMSGKSPSAKYTVVVVIAIATVAATPDRHGDHVPTSRAVCWDNRLYRNQHLHLDTLTNGEGWIA